MIGTTTLLTPDDCFAAAKRRFDQDPEAWKGFSGTMEFVLTDDDGQESVIHLDIDQGELRIVDGPAPGTPSGRVTIGAADLVLFAKGILDEHLLRRRGLLHIEGDMYVLGKLPTCS